jgi:hypothetical protein
LYLWSVALGRAPTTRPPKRPFALCNLALTRSMPPTQANSLTTSRTSPYPPLSHSSHSLTHSFILKLNQSTPTTYVRRACFTSDRVRLIDRTIRGESAGCASHPACLPCKRTSNPSNGGGSSGVNECQPLTNLPIALAVGHLDSRVPNNWAVLGWCLFGRGRLNLKCACLLKFRSPAHHRLYTDSFIPPCG